MRGEGSEVHRRFVSDGLHVCSLPFVTELGGCVSTHALGGKVVTEWRGALVTRFWLWWPRFLPCDKRAWQGLWLSGAGQRP